MDCRQGIKIECVGGWVMDNNIKLYQVYRALQGYNKCSNVISEGTLLQVRTIDGGLIGLKDEDNKTYWLNWRDILNKDNFKIVFA